jgi:small subunit ribosomal protein S6
LREYELMYLLSPELPEDEMTAATERVSSLITNRGGEITKVDTWGRRRLAYPIRRHMDGYYTILRFNFEPGQTVELDRNLRLTEQVLRHIIVHAEDVPPPRTIRRVPVPDDPMRRMPAPEESMRRAPVPEAQAPVSEERAPAAEELAPVLEERAPVSEQSEESPRPAPVAEERTPVVEETEETTRPAPVSKETKE